MKSIFSSMRHLRFSLTSIWLFMGPGFAQTIDREHINLLIEDGNTDRVIEHLHHFLGPRVDISQSDSIFALKTLGMVYAHHQNIDSAKIRFKQLLAIDPTVSIRNTDASHSIIEVFFKAKNDFKKEHGGEILRPKVVVLNPVGSVIEDKYRSSIARQFIEELERLWLFDVMDWDDVQRRLKEEKFNPDTCASTECLANITRLIEGDKLITLRFERVNNIYSLILNYIDAHTKKTESILKRTSVNNLDTLILSGIQDLAIELEKSSAAWLQFSLEPQNAYLELNGSPTSGEKRIPVMPGKHRVCASAVGFEELCKTIEVRSRDGLTHRLVLTPIMSEDAVKPKKSAQSQQAPADAQNRTMGLSTELYILGGLGALALILIFLFQ